VYAVMWYRRDDRSSHTRDDHFADVETEQEAVMLVHALSNDQYEAEYWKPDHVKMQDAQQRRNRRLADRQIALLLRH
jgi:hypothetical protein